MKAERCRTMAPTGLSRAKEPWHSQVLHRQTSILPSERREIYLKPSATTHSNKLRNRVLESKALKTYTRANQALTMATSAVPARRETWRGTSLALTKAETHHKSIRLFQCQNLVRRRVKASNVSQISSRRRRYHREITRTVACQTTSPSTKWKDKSLKGPIRATILPLKDLLKWKKRTLWTWAKFDLRMTLFEGNKIGKCSHDPKLTPCVYLTPFVLVVDHHQIRRNNLLNRIWTWSNLSRHNSLPDEAVVLCPVVDLTKTSEITK